MFRIKVRDWKQRNFKQIGEGGEAVIYKMREDLVAKIFRQPDDLEFKEDAASREAAKVRLDEMQTKLLEFPTDLPEALIAPTAVLVDGRDEVFGYVMPFVKGTSLDAETRTDSKLSLRERYKVITELHDLISGLHAKDVVVGDLGENNLLLREQDLALRMIDADSLQFGPYQCRTFVPRFVDPKILGIGGNVGLEIPTKLAKAKKTRSTGRKSSTQTTRKRKTKKAEKLIPEVSAVNKAVYSLVAPHYKLGDWYSYLVTVMRLLTFTDPYAGVVAGMDLSERLANRVTVFDPRVIYPENARSLKEVPRPILEIFFQVFHRGERFVPEKAVFESLLGKSSVSENKKQAKL
ncbi:MAG: hypothetical protein WC250_02445 [Candidatus Paceibacterota bacterium]|jgi:serine/threonine protein kinase